MRPLQLCDECFATGATNTLNFAFCPVAKAKQYWEAYLSLFCPPETFLHDFFSEHRLKALQKEPHNF